MKKLIIILMLLLACSVCAHADTGNYIVQLKEGERPPISVDAKLIFLEANIWLAHSLEAVEAMGDAVLSYGPEIYMELADYPETTNDTYFELQWNLAAINAEFARKFDVRGQGVTIAVIDSGIDRDNPDFDSARILPGGNFIMLPEPYDPTDTSDRYVGHGTMVSGIIAAQINNDKLLCGIADKVNILPLKVTDTGMVASGYVIKALAYALESGCDVVNMSMGVGGKEPPGMQACIDKLVERGVIVVAAVGNGGSANTDYPSGYEGVIGVGSVTKDLEHSSFSNHNTSVFCVAPGSDIVGLSIKDGEDYKTGNGTSYSAPVVSAAAALAKSIDPDLTLDDFKQLLIESCTDLGEEGYDEYFGYGLINIQKMLEIQFEKLKSPITVYDFYEDGDEMVYCIRNTSDTVFANLYYASYNDEGDQLADICMKDMELETGYTEARFTKRDNSRLYIWEADTMRPLVSPTDDG